MKRSKELQNELAKLREMTDNDIDYSDIPQTEDSWLATAELALELISDNSKRKISMMVDNEVLDYFRASGRGYQTRINAVLKGYVWDKKRQQEKEKIKPVL